VNSTLRQINVFGQKGGTKWGEPCLGQWVAMYATNVTLLNIVWRTSSRQTVALTKLMARNTDINRALKQGKDYFHHLPDGLRADPPHLLHYDMPDVRTTRGAIAAKPGRASVHAGVVMRNGVADAVAPAGTIAARLAAMRGAAVQAPAPAAAHAAIKQQGWAERKAAQEHKRQAALEHERIQSMEEELHKTKLAIATASPHVKHEHAIMNAAAVSTVLKCMDGSASPGQKAAMAGHLSRVTQSMGDAKPGDDVVAVPAFHSSGHTMKHAVMNRAGVDLIARSLGNTASTSPHEKMKVQQHLQELAAHMDAEHDHSADTVLVAQHSVSPPELHRLINDPRRGRAHRSHSAAWRRDPEFLKLQAQWKQELDECHVLATAQDANIQQLRAQVVELQNAHY